MKRLLLGVVLASSLMGVARAEGLNEHQTQAVEEKLRLFFLNKGMSMASLGWATQAILHDEATTCNKYASDLLTGEDTSPAVLDRALAACSGPPTPISTVSDKAAAPAIGQGRCQDDWRGCKDNEDLVNHWSRISEIRVMCEQTGKQRAKFGTPQFGESGFLAPPSFASYEVGNNYPKDGAVTLVEQNAHFQNAYGAMARARAYCTYDLRANKISTFFLSPDEVSDLADPLYAGGDLREP